EGVVAVARGVIERIGHRLEQTAARPAVGGPVAQRVRHAEQVSAAIVGSRGGEAALIHHGGQGVEGALVLIRQQAAIGQGHPYDVARAVPCVRGDSRGRCSAASPRRSLRRPTATGSAPAALLLCSALLCSAASCQRTTLTLR